MTYSITCSCGARWEIPSSMMSNREKLKEFVDTIGHRECGKRATANPGGAYEDGWKAGYQKGVDAGMAIGYSDAKMRAYLAIDGLTREIVRGEASLAPRDIRRRVEDALAAVVGARA